jgi:transcriptional regulator with XRE-family HTH domain
MSTEKIVPLELDEEAERILAQERLIVEATEVICELLERDGVTRQELAERLGKTKGFVSQVLSGERNMTLRTLSDFAFVLGRRLRVSPAALGGGSSSKQAFVWPQPGKTETAREAYVDLVASGWVRYQSAGPRESPSTLVQATTDSSGVAERLRSAADRENDWRDSARRLVRSSS